MSEEKKEFAEKLSELCDEYGLKNCCFCGEDGEKMLGLFCVDKIKYGGATGEDLMKSTVNTARLYQSSREKLMSKLDQIAGV